MLATREDVACSKALVPHLHLQSVISILSLITISSLITNTAPVPMVLQSQKSHRQVEGNALSERISHGADHVLAQ